MLSFINPFEQVSRRGAKERGKLIKNIKTDLLEVAIKKHRAVYAAADRLLGALKQIASALGVSAGAVSQWIARGRAGGVEALRNRPHSGAIPKLSEQQRQQLPDLLRLGAQAYGFAGTYGPKSKLPPLSSASSASAIMLII